MDILNIKTKVELNSMKERFFMKKIKAKKGLQLNVKVGNKKQCYECYIII